MHGKLLNYLWIQLDKLQHQTSVKHHHNVVENGYAVMWETLTTSPFHYEELNHSEKINEKPPEKCYLVIASRTNSHAVVVQENVSFRCWIAWFAAIPTSRKAFVVRLKFMITFQSVKDSERSETVSPTLWEFTLVTSLRVYRGWHNQQIFVTFVLFPFECTPIRKPNSVFNPNISINIYSQRRDETN